MSQNSSSSFNNDLTPNSTILLITNDFGPHEGGIESFILGLLRGIKDRTVIIFTSNHPGAKEFDQKFSNFSNIKIFRDRSKILLPTFRISLKARRLVKENKVEIVWFGAGAPLGLLANSLRKVGVKRIIALTHGHEYWWAKLPIFKQLLRRIINSSDFVTCLGDFTQSQISKVVTNKRNSRTQILKLAPGIDTEMFKPGQKNQQLLDRYGLNNRPVLVSVGRLVHRKGQDKLIMAWPKVLAHFPNAILLFIGDGPIKQMLINLAKQERVINNVRFAGKVAHDQLTNHILLGDIFAMPARNRFFNLEVEGLGIVYLEASACGLPVIVGNSGGAGDAVIDSKTGYLVDGSDITDISNRIIELLKNPELAKDFGKTGRDWVVKNWRWPIWQAKFNQLLN